MQYGTFVTVLVQESLLPGDASATYSVSFKSWKGTVRYSAPESTFCSLGTPTGARMVISVRLNMCLCKSRGRADQKPGGKKRCKSAEPHVFPPFSSEATLRARLFLGQEGDPATRGETRRSRGIQDVCVMLFDTWADCLCQTWRGAPFYSYGPQERLLEEELGEKEAARGNELLVDPRDVCVAELLHIHKFIFHQSSPFPGGRAMGGRSMGGPFGHAWLVKCSTVGKAALCFCLLFVFSWGT